MQHFNERCVFNDLAKKKEAIRLYAMEDKTPGQISVVFDCPVEHVERMLSAQGQLL
jgi:DNA-directed RNA polymerase specialized sigma24 family protein